MCRNRELTYILSWWKPLEDAPSWKPGPRAGLRDRAGYPHRCCLCFRSRRDDHRTRVRTPHLFPSICRPKTLKKKLPLASILLSSLVDLLLTRNFSAFVSIRNHGSHFEKHKTAIEEGGGNDEPGDNSEEASPRDSAEEKPGSIRIEDEKRPPSETA